MIVPLTAAAVTLFYLGAIPVHLCLRLDTDSGFGAGVSLFEPRFARQRARRPRTKPTNPPFQNIDVRAALGAGLRMLKSLSAHARIERLRLTGRFGCGNAALTAMVCGGLMALGNALTCAARREVRLELTPDFSGATLHADLSGMISARAGHIMIAALLGAYEYGTRRLQSWTSIPSKAS